MKQIDMRFFLSGDLAFNLTEPTSRVKRSGHNLAAAGMIRQRPGRITIPRQGTVPMRVSIVTTVICTVLLLGMYGKSLLAVNDAPPAQQGDTPARRIRSSDKAVVRNVVYGLEEEESHLHLTSKPLDGGDRELKRTELKFAVPNDGQVVEMSLAKMGGRHLVAVVKVRRGDEYDFHCLTFISPSLEEHVRDKHRFYQEKFLSTRDDLRILALTGTGHTAFAVLGEFDWDEYGTDDVPALKSEGVFYFTSCPWPPMGQIAPYLTKAAKIKTK
jgi:hypothetical protein